MTFIESWCCYKVLLFCQNDKRKIGECEHIIYFNSWKEKEVNIKVRHYRLWVEVDNITLMLRVNDSARRVWRLRSDGVGPDWIHLPVYRPTLLLLVSLWGVCWVIKPSLTLVAEIKKNLHIQYNDTLNSMTFFEK